MSDSKSEKDYYQILNVQPNCPHEDIRTAYKALALRFHPDKASSAEEQATNNEKMKEVNEAHAVLGNSENRSQYDRNFHSAYSKTTHQHPRARDKKPYSKNKKPENPEANADQQKINNLLLKKQLEDAVLCYLEARNKGYADAISIKWSPILKLIKAVLEDGKPSDQCELGEHYEHGNKIPKNIKRAFKYYEMAAAKDHAEAQYRLGLCYLYGKGVGRNVIKAIELFQMAAAKDHAEAQYRLGLCYLYGKGVGRNVIKAIELFQMAAIQNHSNAQYKLAHTFEQEKITGEGSNPLFWYKSAADRGHVEAQCKVGDISFTEGRGEEAMKYYLMAAQKDSPHGLYGRGRCYEFGRGIDKNLQYAFAYYSASTDGDNPSHAGQFRLGIFYESGQGGVNRDLEKARKYYQQAAKNKYPGAASKLQSVQEQIAQAKAKTYTEEEQLKEFCQYTDWTFERDTQKAIEESRAISQSMSIDNKQKVDKKTTASAPPVFLIPSSSLSDLDEEEQLLKEFCQSSKDFYNQLAILSSSPTVNIKEVKEKIDTTIFGIAVSNPERYKQYLDTFLQTLTTTISLLYTQYWQMHKACLKIILYENIVKYSVITTMRAAEMAKEKLNLLSEYAQQMPDDKNGNVKKCLIAIEGFKKNLNSNIKWLKERSLSIVAEHKSESPINFEDNSQQFFNTRIPPHTSTGAPSFTLCSSPPTTSSSASSTSSSSTPETDSSCPKTSGSL